MLVRTFELVPESIRIRIHLTRYQKQGLFELTGHAG